jgi:hypothetical protein
MKNSLVKKVILRLHHIAVIPDPFCVISLSNVLRERSSLTGFNGQQN